MTTSDVMLAAIRGLDPSGEMRVAVLREGKAEPVCIVSLDHQVEGEGVPRVLLASHRADLERYLEGRRAEADALGLRILGATGERVAAPLVPEDEGVLQMQVASSAGKVLINFGKRVSWIGLSPDDASALARTLEAAVAGSSEPHDGR